MIVAVNAIYAIAYRNLKKIQDFNGVWTRDPAGVLYTPFDESFPCNI